MLDARLVELAEFGTQGTPSSQSRSGSEERKKQGLNVHCCIDTQSRSVDKLVRTDLLPLAYKMGLVDVKFERPRSMIGARKR